MDSDRSSLLSQAEARGQAKTEASRSRAAASEAARFDVAQHTGLTRAERRARAKAGYYVPAAKNKPYEKGTPA